MNSTQIVLIRHAQTPGNALKRYIGRTDEPLSSEGIRQANALAGIFRERESLSGFLEDTVIWISSPMIRCTQTARLILDTEYFSREKELLICEELRECDFGQFEGKNYKELSGNRLYQDWIDSGGTSPFPGGEAPSAFRNRSCDAFLRLIREHQSDADKICIVAHGGTIMSILERWGVDESGERHDYYGWHVGNACGFRLKLVPEDAVTASGSAMRLEAAERIEQPL